MLNDFIKHLHGFFLSTNQIQRINKPKSANNKSILRMSILM
ncbi:hypothetical protein OMAG_000742 [Candidatus Omnitrophus magneticus]|uniref:Transposase n=1 Tax=Candidatus Omnitrophus magneticus TaxID=1609969 RepID=A0A0F0CVD4_9BACT|nr:hypothetical protein OMAG_000742 [Candidatus Omnitrophus magneticus]